MYEKAYIWNPVACSCENDKYVGSVIDDSVIKCRRKKTIPSKTVRTETVPGSFSKKGNL